MVGVIKPQNKKKEAISGSTNIALAKASRGCDPGHHKGVHSAPLGPHLTDQRATARWYVTGHTVSLI